MEFFWLWCGEDCCSSKLTNGCFKKPCQTHQLHVLCCFVIFLWKFGLWSICPMVSQQTKCFFFFLFYFPKFCEVVVVGGVGDHPINKTQPNLATFHRAHQKKQIRIPAIYFCPTCWKLFSKYGNFFFFFCPSKYYDDNYGPFFSKKNLL